MLLLILLILRGAQGMNGDDPAYPIYQLLKMGVTFRNNVIATFGTILYHPNVPISEESYTSLYFLLRTFQRNQLDVIKLIQGTPKSEFGLELLFLNLEKKLPSHLACMASHWYQLIKSKQFSWPNRFVIEKTIDQTNMAEILTTITEKRYKVGPKILAALLHYLPRAQIRPNFEESILELSEYLEKTSTDWNDFNRVAWSQAKNLTVLVRSGLEYILGNKLFGKDIKKCAEIILQNLDEDPTTALNPHYGSMSKYVSPKKLALHQMLQYVNVGEYPLEIIMAAVGIRFSKPWESGQMGDFNPYVFQTSTEVLLVALIQMADASNSTELIKSILGVYSYVLFKYRMGAMPLEKPTELDLKVLFASLQVPGLSEIIQGESSNLQSYCNNIVEEKIPIHDCPNPVMCLLAILKKTQMKNLGQQFNTSISVLLSTCSWGQCPLQKRTSNWRMKTRTEENKPPLSQMLRRVLHFRELSDENKEAFSTVIEFAQNNPKVYKLWLESVTDIRPAEFVSNFLMFLREFGNIEEDVHEAARSLFPHIDPIENFKQTT